MSFVVLAMATAEGLSVVSDWVQSDRSGLPVITPGQ